MHHVYGLADQLWNLPKYAPKLGQMLDVFNDFRVHERIGHPMLTNQHIPTPYIGFKLKYDNHCGGRTDTVPHRKELPGHCYIGTPARPMLSTLKS